MACNLSLFIFLTSSPTALSYFLQEMGLLVVFLMHELGEGLLRAFCLSPLTQTLAWLAASLPLGLARISPVVQAPL